MTDWIKDAATSAAGDLWAKLLYYVTFQFLDPFWGWLSMGVTIIVVLTVLVWVLTYFFGELFKWVRPIAGLIVVVIIALLAGFRRGEKEAREFDKKKKRR